MGRGGIYVAISMGDGNLNVYKALLWFTKLHVRSSNCKFSIYCSCLHEETIPFDSFLILLCEKLSIQKEIAFGNINCTTFQNTFQHAFATWV